MTLKSMWKTYSMYLTKALISCVIILLITAGFFIFNYNEAYSSEENTIRVINTTTTTGYETLDAAVLDANDGEEVQIIVEGTYVVDCFRTGFYVPNHITISANESLNPDKVILDGVCYDEEWKSDYPIFYAPKGIDFKNLTLDVGNHAYHGFWAAEKAFSFDNCIIKGWFWTSIDTSFYNCQFLQESRNYYCVYTYAGNILFDNCYFNAYGRFVNIFKEDCGNKTTIEFNNCEFESNEKQKSAINVKASDGWPLGDHLLKWNVVITGCSTIGDNFPTDNRLNSPLVMIDDGNSPDIEISVGDSPDNLSEIYPPPPEYYVLTVGEGRQLHTSLEVDATYESLIWESLTPEVVTVSSTGHIDQVKSGFARITATTTVTGIVAEFNVSFPCFKFHMNGHGEQIDDIYTEPYRDDQSSLKPPDPWEEGFIFNGWYVDEGLTNLYKWDKKQTSDLDLYAKWTKDPGSSHTVTFYPRNGAPETSVQVLDGEKVSQPQDPTWDDDHIFLFWTENLDCENSKPFDFNTEIHSDLNLYAAWSVTEVEVDVDVPDEIVIDEQSKAVCSNMATEILLSLSAETPSLPEGIVLDGNLEEQQEAFLELVEIINIYKEDMENRELHVTISPHAEDKEKQVPIQEVIKFEDICLPNVDFATSYGVSCVYNFCVDYAVAVIGDDITVEKIVSLSEISEPLKYEIRDLANKESMWDGAIQVLRFHDNAADDISGLCIADRVNQKIFIMADKFSTYLVDYSPDLFIYFDHNYKGGPIDKIICPYNSPVTQIPVPVRENYKFNNWYSDSDCTELYDFSRPLVIQTKVYASWDEVPAPTPENPEYYDANVSTADNCTLPLVILVLLFYLAFHINISLKNH